MDVDGPKEQLKDKQPTKHGAAAAQHLSHSVYFSVKDPMFYMPCILHIRQIMKERY